MLTYIVGAGAMGCRFGYQMAEAGQKVVLFDGWQDHIQAIKEKGLIITGDQDKTVALDIRPFGQDAPVCDLMILFVKAHQLETTLKETAHLRDQHTKVFCLLNGLGHEEVIKRYVDPHNIMMGVTVWTAVLVGPGQVRLKDSGTINFCALDPSGKELGLEVEALLNQAGLNATYDEEVFKAIWTKACVNGTMNSTCALTDCTIAEFFSSEEGRLIVRQLLHEFVTVAKAKGIVLDEEKIYQYLMDLSVKLAGHYPSMHQDLVQQKRLTEIDYINGAVARMGADLGIDTPYCKMVTEFIHVKERQIGVRT